MGEFLATITITLRKSILDPQGKAVEHAIATMNVGTIRDVRIGKHVEMRVMALNQAQATAAVEEVCKKLLANPVMEDYHFAIEEV